MYLDGFTPDEIMYANRKRMGKIFEEQHLAKRIESNLVKMIENELLKDFR